jgi:MFS family permease
MFGGYLADKFGRKMVIMVFPGIGWIGTMTTWFLAREPWHMILAALFLGLTTPAWGVWETLLVEDTEPAYRISVYSFIQMGRLFSSVLTPVAGTLIFLYGVDQGSRLIFFIGLVTTIIMIVFRQVFLVESKIGDMLMSSDRKTTSKPKNYFETIKSIAKHKNLLILFALTSIGTMQYPLINTYRPLFLIDSNAMALDESIVSVIPMTSSLSGLILLVFFFPRLKYSHIKKGLQLSFVCGLLGLLILIIAPKGSLILAIFSAVLDSVRRIAVSNILRVFFVNMIDKVNPFARAKIMSLNMVSSALVSWPMSLIGGYLYVIDPIFPFILIAFFLVLSMSLMFKVE